MTFLLETQTPLAVKVTVTAQYWDYIIRIKHPAMSGKEELVKELLAEPQEIRQSKIDSTIFLYYKTIGRLYCAVVKHEGDRGFLITTYPADKVKEGEVIWKK